MNYLRLDLLPWVMGGLAIGALLFFWLESRFFAWVKAHWFFRRHPVHLVSSILLVVGFGLLSVILLDPRAGEIKIKGKVRQAKTIILIDTST